MMPDLEALVASVIAHGADSRLFPQTMEQLGSLSPADAVMVLLKALSKNPDLLLPRLELARLFWQLDCTPFALEQLIHIHKTPATFGRESIAKLIESLGGTIAKTDSPSSTSVAPEKTLASLDFDIEVLDPDNS